MCDRASPPANPAWDYIPSIVGVVAVLYMMVTLVCATPPLLTRDSYTPFTTDSDLEPLPNAAAEAAKEGLSLVWNLSNYATTSSTLLFAAFGAFVANFKPTLRYSAFVIPVLSALALLVGAYINGYLANSEAISELAYGGIALKGGDSKIIYYMEREVKLALLSIITIVITFIVIARPSFQPK